MKPAGLCPLIALMLCPLPALAAPVANTGDTRLEAGNVVARVTVDWSRTVGKTTPALFGSNDFGIIDPKSGAGDPQFAKNLAATGIAFLRIHNGGLSEAWASKDAQGWDEAKIKAAYDAPYLRGKMLLQNIPGWPSWMKHSDGLLDPSEYDRYARFCADLVGIINQKQHRHVMLWEPLNEQDQNYWQKGKFDDLCALYNKVAVAMKARDPSIKVGGMAFTWDDPAKVEAFLKNCGPNIDFISWHRYASGDAKDSTEKIMAGTPAFDARARTFRALADKYVPSRKIPLVLDEYSLDYTWTSGETRQWSSIGAVWFASVLKHMADAGLEMSASWNLKDGFYGLIGGDDKPRPAATVYAWANRSLVGTLAQTKSDQPLVEAMAVRQANGGKSLLLINKASGTATVTLQGMGGISGGQAAQLDGKGVADLTLSAGKPITLPPYSLLLLRAPGGR